MKLGGLRSLARGMIERAERVSSAAAVVLMYHRVADLDHDVHGLAVHPDRFRSQMQMLAELYRPILVTDLARMGRTGRIPRGTVCVTFDDGYADNVEVALPILEEAGVSASFFIVTDHIGADREYWWDSLERLLLVPDTTDSRHLVVELGLERRSWTLHNATRREIHDDIHRHLLLHATATEREAILDSIARQTGTDTGPRRSHRTLTDGELVRLANASGMEIGAHTATHPSLAALSPDEQHQQIESSVNWLEDRLQRRIPSFSYPHGHYTPHAITVLEGLGVEAAVTTDPVPWRRSREPLAMGRLAVGDWEAERLRAEIDRFSKLG